MAVDNIARAGLSAVRIASSHMFSSAAERDAYFAANPSELVDNVYITVNETLQKRVNGEWVDVTAVIKGQKGDTGAQGPKGDSGSSLSVAFEIQGENLIMLYSDGTVPPEVSIDIYGHLILEVE